MQSASHIIRRYAMQHLAMYDALVLARHFSISTLIFFYLNLQHSDCHICGEVLSGCLTLGSVLLHSISLCPIFICGIVEWRPHYAYIYSLHNSTVISYITLYMCHHVFCIFCRGGCSRMKTSSFQVWSFPVGSNCTLNVFYFL